MKRGKNWTPDELAIFTHLYLDERLTLKEAALKIGRSLDSAKGVVRAHRIFLTYADRLRLKCPELTPTELAYLAGIIDGEGSVMFWHNRKAGKTKPGVTITSTSEALVTWLRERVRFSDAFTVRHSRQAKRLPAWAFVFQGISFVPFYEALLPYLIVKQRQMELLIAFSRSRLSQRIVSPILPEEWALVEQCKALTQRWSRLSDADE
jgi:hypothetical protein